MLRAFLRWRLASAEKAIGEPLDYLRHILSVTLRGFFAFLKLTSFAGQRRALPLGAFHLARIVATKAEDCGTCVQTAVNAARKDGIDVAILRSVIAGKPASLPDELAEVYRFTDAVVRATYDEGELREKLRARWGDEALIELALVVSSVRAYPLTKRVLGYATSCSKVTVEVME